MADIAVAEGVISHYSGSGIAERILAAAERAGITEITATALAPTDEFHTGGIVATRELATLAAIGSGEHVIDIGAGLGGPARVLATEYGCRVTGIDLTPEFVEAATTLTARCRLDGPVTFETANALALPYPDGTFDVAWTQHVVMNIGDRAGFYAEAYRVLKPGGRLAFFDVLEGNGKALDFPVPWANTPAISFLYTPEQTRDFLRNAGFEEVTWQDATEQYLRAFDTLASVVEENPFSLQIVLGQELGQKIRNIGAAIKDGRLRLARAVYRKPG